MPDRAVVADDGGNVLGVVHDGVVLDRRPGAVRAEAVATGASTRDDRRRSPRSRSPQRQDAEGVVVDLGFERPSA
jgi:hypothetical protein